MIECVDRDLLKTYVKKVDKMIQNRELENILPFLQENFSTIKHDNDLMIVWYLGVINRKEKEAGLKGVFEKESSLEELLDRYHQLKFYLRRIENDILDDTNEFFLFLANYNVSEYEIKGIVDNSIYYQEKVWAYFQKVH
ncbi:MAG: hypothetical protein IKY94_03240 [Lachnospiraceae bacterium]|nr:hypothetical protein [Lachnospiraceae bacterium]